MVQLGVKIPPKLHNAYLNQIQATLYITGGSQALRFILPRIRRDYYVRYVVAQRTACRKCRSGIIALIIHIRSEWAARDFIYWVYSVKRVSIMFPQSHPFILIHGFDLQRIRGLTRAHSLSLIQRKLTAVF